MAKSHPELFRDLHAQILEVGLSMNRAMNYINARIDNEQVQLAKLNNQNMGAHFSSHITIPDRVNQELVKLPTGTQSLTSISPTIGYEIQDMVRRRVGNDVNDYLNLDSLRSQMMEKLEFLDEVVAKEVDGKKLVDLEALSQYTSLIKEIRNCIVDLNKIRQSKQLMNMVIKSLIEKQTMQVVRELSREYDQIKQDLIASGVDSTIVVRIDQNLRLKLAEVVAITARSALEDVTRAYKL
jgi:hypothetical protein